MFTNSSFKTILILPPYLTAECRLIKGPRSDQFPNIFQDAHSFSSEIIVGPEENMIKLWKVWRTAFPTTNSNFIDDVPDGCEGEAYLRHLFEARRMYLAKDKENCFKWGKNGKIKKIILEILLDPKNLGVRFHSSSE